MKKILLILLFCLNYFFANAQSINYIKFRNTENNKVFKLITNRYFQIHLKNYLLPFFSSKITNSYDSLFGIKLKLIGCNKDSLLFNENISIPIYAITKIDRVKQQTVVNSILLASNMSVMGIVNYYTVSKYHHVSPIFFSNLPFILFGTALLTTIPNSKKGFYLHNWIIEEYKYYDPNLDCTFSFKTKNIFNQIK